MPVDNLTLAYSMAIVVDCTSIIIIIIKQFVSRDRFAISVNNFSYQRPVLEATIFIPDE